jgi:hypothetical protein
MRGRQLLPSAIPLLSSSRIRFKILPLSLMMPSTISTTSMSRPQKKVRVRKKKKKSQKK